MKKEDIEDEECICFLSRRNNDIGVFGYINYNKYFEGISIYIEDDVYVISLTDITIDNNPPLKAGYIEMINSAIDKIGGLDFIIDQIQSKYNEYLNDKDFSDCFNNLEKDNIRKYITKKQISILQKVIE